MARARTCRLALLLALVAGDAAAGPWPRAEGEVFLSFSGEGNREGDSYASLYGEYGLTLRNTLGFEVGHSNSGETSALAWLQRALDRGEGADRWVVSLGLGAIRRDDSILPVAQVAAGWGRGLDAVPLLSRVPGGGWLGVEARVKVAGAIRDDALPEEVAAAPFAYLTPEMETKAEVTLGWNVTPSTMLVNQLRLEERDDTGFASKFAVSVVRDLTGAAKLELGVIEPLSGEGERAVKLGTWLSF